MSIKHSLKLLGSILLYIPKALLVIILKILTMILAPVLALPIFVRFRDETSVTGYPSQFPNKLRAFLIKPLMGFQTQDDCLDAFWYSTKYKNSWMAKYNQIDFDTKWWLRYCNYVAWLWRNPAYQFADWLGWYNKDHVILKKRDQDNLWKTGIPNFSYWLVKNGRGGVSFAVQGQLYYYKQYCIEYNLGYGFKRFEPDDRCMLNIRIIPWRKYMKEK